MYAVIKAGGKQHRVFEGEILRIEKIEQETGAVVQFDEVLMVASADEITIGSPLVEGATVKAEVVQHGRGDKVKIIKFRRRKHSMKRQGHRQWFTEIKITDILASEKSRNTKKQALAKQQSAKQAESKPAEATTADDS